MEGDVIGKMRLDISDIQPKLNRVESAMKKTLKTFQTVASRSSKTVRRDLDNVIAQHKRAAAATALAHKKAALSVSRNWWDSFGKVALGFTIAYRAMNLFERGMQKVSETLLDAIRESGELAAFQAKQALWFKMYSKDVITYAEAFNRAAVNTKALADASIASMASLEELTTGFDELGQAGIIAGKSSTKIFADLVSFTTLIAQTVGSTTRQIRQEFQALSEGQVRTTNILIRTMLRLGVISDKDVSNLKHMVDTEKIILKIATKISEEWSEVENHIISADPLTAMRYWEKHIKAIWRQTITLASALEGVENIFADVFVEHARKLRESLETEPQQGLVTFMFALRDALDLALTAFEKFIDFTASSAIVIQNLSDEIAFVSKVIGGILAVKLGEFFVKMSLGLHKFLLIPLRTATARLLALPALFVALAVGIESLSPKFKMTEKDIETFGKKAALSVDWILEKLKIAREQWDKWLYGDEEPTYKDSFKNYKESYVENMKSFLNAVKSLAAPTIAEINELFDGLGNPKDPEKIKTEVDEMLEGLTSLLDGTVHADKKTLNQRLQLSQKFRDDIKKLTLSEADFKIYKLQQTADKAEALGLDEVLLEKWFTLEKDAIHEEADKKRIADADKTDSELRRKKQQSLKLMQQMQRDYVTDRFKLTQADAKAEYKARLITIDKLIAGEAEKRRYQIAALRAYNAKVLAIEGTFADGLAQARRLRAAAEPSDYERGLKFLDTREEVQRAYLRHCKSSYALEYHLAEKHSEKMLKLAKDDAELQKKIKQTTKKQLEDIKKEELKSNLAGTEATMGVLADGFKMMSEMGGKHSKEMFATFKAFKIIETMLSTYASAVKAYESMLWIPVVGPALGAAAATAVTAFGLARIGQIKALKAPSYDQGGVSTIPGTYYAGVPEAHIPLQKGAVPVALSGERKTPTIVLNNPVFQDLETQRQVMTQIATIIATQVAPGAVKENYDNDGEIRQMVRGGI